jgi:hypothetical protein
LKEDSFFSPRTEHREKKKRRIEFSFFFFFVFSLDIIHPQIPPLFLYSNGNRSKYADKKDDVFMVERQFPSDLFNLRLRLLL